MDGPGEKRSKPPGAGNFGVPRYRAVLGELRNLVAKYPFERSRRFPGSSRILATETIRFAFELRRSEYAARALLLGSRPALLVINLHRGRADCRDFCRSKDDP